MSNYDVNNYPVEQKNSNHFVRNVAIGSAATAGLIGCRAFNKANRADTFINTSKNCLKSYTKKGQNDVVEIAKMLKSEKVANWIGKVSNKKLCAAFLATDILAWGYLLGGIKDWLSK